MAAGRLVTSFMKLSPSDERGGPGEHRGDAAEIGGSAHEGGSLGRASSDEQF